MIHIFAVGVALGAWGVMLYLNRPKGFPTMRMLAHSNALRTKDDQTVHLN